MRARSIPLVILAVVSIAWAVPANRTALMKSALLPGWGQHSLGYGTRGYVFMGVEAATWLGAGLSWMQSSWNRDDYVSLAMAEAGVDADGRSTQFLDDLADFSSSDEYNDYIRSLARYYYPDDPDAQREYYERHARYGADGWSWSSDEARERFYERLKDSRNWSRRALYVAGFALVNRAVSAIDAALLDDLTSPGLYTEMEFPRTGDLSAVRFTLGVRF